MDQEGRRGRELGGAGSSGGPADPASEPLRSQPAWLSLQRTLPSDMTISDEEEGAMGAAYASTDASATAGLYGGDCVEDGASRAREQQSVDDLAEEARALRETVQALHVRALQEEVQALRQHAALRERSESRERDELGSVVPQLAAAAPRPQTRGAMAAGCLPLPPHWRASLQLPTLAGVSSALAAVSSALRSSFVGVPSSVARVASHPCTGRVLFHALWTAVGPALQVARAVAPVVLVV